MKSQGYLKGKMCLHLKPLNIARIIHYTCDHGYVAEPQSQRNVSSLRYPSEIITGITLV